MLIDFPEGVRKSGGGVEQALAQRERIKNPNETEVRETKRDEARDRDALSGHSIICRTELPPLSLLSAGRLFVRSVLSPVMLSVHTSLDRWPPRDTHTYTYTRDAPSDASVCIARIRRSLFRSRDERRVMRKGR